MSDFIIKGTVIGYEYEKWKKDKSILSSMLISVMTTWEMNYRSDLKDNRISTELKREYGRIVNAYLGFMNDIHNLAITLDMIKSNLNNQFLDYGKKIMYVTLLLEVYFTNLRTIYDFISYFPKLLIEEKKLSHLPSKKEGSIKELIKFLKKESAKEFISQEIIDVFIKCEENLDEIRKIRDLIIHKGKEPILIIDNNGEFRFSINLNTTDDSSFSQSIPNEEFHTYDLNKYLCEITNSLFDFIENLGQSMYQEYLKKDTDYRVYLGGLKGLCIPDFIEFLGWNNYLDNENCNVIQQVTKDEFGGLINE